MKVIQKNNKQSKSKAAFFASSTILNDETNLSDDLISEDEINNTNNISDDNSSDSDEISDTAADTENIQTAPYGIEEVSLSEIKEMAAGVKKQPSVSAFNTEALQRKLDEMINSCKIPFGLKRIPWVDSLALISQYKLPNDLKPSNDTDIETHIYDITLSNVFDGLKRLKSMNMPFCRPQDFMAEMLKGDKHMTAVRGKIATEQAKIRAVDKRKKSQFDKKFGRQLREEKRKKNAVEAAADRVSSVHEFKNSGKTLKLKGKDGNKKKRKA